MSYEFIKKLALTFGLISIVGAFVHGVLWWSIETQYVSFIESNLSPDGTINHPELALAWCLAALGVAGIAGLYTGLRDIDVFNLPDAWSRWDVGFLIWMGFCVLAPLALGIKVRLNEDGFLEWSTFWAAGFAGLIVAFVAVRSQSIVLVVVAAALFFFAGEEISWGQRVFGFGTPETLSKLNHQQETNLHNLIRVLSLAYLTFFTVAAFTVLEIKGILGFSPVSKLLRQEERNLLVEAVNLPFFAVILFAIGFVAGYTDEFAEVLFACSALGVSVRLMFVSALKRPAATFATTSSDSAG